MSGKPGILVFTGVGKTRAARPKTSAILRILFVDKSFDISREAIQVKQLFTPKALNSVAQGKVSEANDALGTVTRKYECQQRKFRPTWHRLKHACMRV